jgi:hypothetical protein
LAVSLVLPKENKYALKSLRACSEITAVKLGKAAYLELRQLAAR